MPLLRVCCLFLDQLDGSKFIFYLDSAGNETVTMVIQQDACGCAEGLLTNSKIQNGGEEEKGEEKEERHGPWFGSKIDPYFNSEKE